MEQNYFEVLAMNASTIKAGAESMLKMADYIENGMDATAAMQQGTRQHRAVLEPETLQKYHVEECDGRTKAGKELKELHGDNLITPKQFAELAAIQKQVWNHAEVLNLGLLQGGEAEKEIYWSEGGIKCKAKLDYYAPEHFVEYKSCNNLAKFTSSAAQMRYELQLGWYWRAAYCANVKQKKCFVIAQESKRPYDVAVFEVPEIMLNTWFNQALEIVHRYINGDRSGAFPKLMTFELPAWAPGANAEHDAETMLEF